MDEQLHKVNRTTRLNNPDVSLGAEQINAMHQSALKKMNQSAFAVDSTQALPMRFRIASSSDGCGLDTTPDHVGGKPDDLEGGEGEGDENDDENDENLDPQQYLGLLGRLAKEKKRAAPGGPTLSANQPIKKPKGQTPASGPGGVTSNTKTNKRRKIGENTAPTPKPPMFEDETGIEGTSEDHTLVEPYKKQLAEVMKLDADKSDDAALAVWIKERTKKVNDLKAGVLGKKKSLRRRTSDTTFLFGELDNIVAELTGLQTLLKKLVNPRAAQSMRASPATIFSLMFPNQSGNGPCALQRLRTILNELVVLYNEFTNIMLYNEFTNNR